MAMGTLDKNLENKAEFHRLRSTQHEAIAELAMALHSIGWQFDDADELADLLGENFGNSMSVKVGDQTLVLRFLPGLE